MAVYTTRTPQPYSNYQGPVLGFEAEAMYALSSGFRAATSAALVDGFGFGYVRVSCFVGPSSLLENASPTKRSKLRMLFSAIDWV